MCFFISVGNMSAGTQAAVDTVKEQNTLISDCSQKFMQCYTDQTVVLRDGLARIADSITRLFMALRECEGKVPVKEEVKESALDIIDEDTLPYYPELNVKEETLTKQEQELLEEILEKEDEEEGEKNDDSSSEVKL